MGNIICYNNQNETSTNNTERRKKLSTTLNPSKWKRNNSLVKLGSYKIDKMRRSRRTIINSLPFSILFFENNLYNKTTINRIKFDTILSINNIFFFFSIDDSINIKNTIQIEHEEIMRLKYEFKNLENIKKWIIKNINNFLNNDSIKILGYRFSNFEFSFYYNKKDKIKEIVNEYKYISFDKKKFSFNDFKENLKNYKKTNFYFYYFIEYFDDLIIILKKYKKKINLILKKLSIKISILNSNNINSELNGILLEEEKYKIKQLIVDPCDNYLIIIYKTYN